MTSPSAVETSLSTALSRSSNSPRNFAPQSAPRGRGSPTPLPRVLRYIAGGDALRDAFHDSCFAHARLADKHRVILAPPLKTCITRRTSSSRPITGRAFRVLRGPSDRERIYQRVILPFRVWVRNTGVSTDRAQCIRARLVSKPSFSSNERRAAQGLKRDVRSTYSRPPFALRYRPL